MQAVMTPWLWAFAVEGAVFVALVLKGFMNLRDDRPPKTWVDSALVLLVIAATGAAWFIFSAHTMKSEILRVLLAAEILVFLFLSMRWFTGIWFGGGNDHRMKKPVGVAIACACIAATVFAMML